MGFGRAGDVIICRLKEEPAVKSMSFRVIIKTEVQVQREPEGSDRNWLSQALDFKFVVDLKSQHLLGR